MGVSSQELSRMVGGSAPIVDTERIDWQIKPVIGALTAEMDESFTVEERATEIIRAVDSNPRYWNEEDVVNPSTFFAEFAVGSLKYLSEKQILRSMIGESREVREVKDLSSYRLHRLAAIAGQKALMKTFDQYVATKPGNDADIFDELVHVTVRTEAAIVNGHHDANQIKADSKKIVRGFIGEWLAGYILEEKNFSIRRATPQEDARGKDLFVLGRHDDRETSIQVKSLCRPDQRIGVEKDSKHAADLDVVVPFPPDDRRRVSFTKPDCDTRDYIESVRGKTKHRYPRGSRTVRPHRYSHR